MGYLLLKDSETMFFDLRPANASGTLFTFWQGSNPLAWGRTSQTKCTLLQREAGTVTDEQKYKAGIMRSYTQPPVPSSSPHAISQTQLILARGCETGEEYKQKRRDKMTPRECVWELRGLVLL